jgi:hypothetical protein
MAKPLGDKARLIRDAILAHPNLGNKELAEMINASDARKDDRIKVKPNDIAAQKQALKKVQEASPAAQEPPSAPKRGRPQGSGRKPAPTPAAEAAIPAVPRSVLPPPPASSPVDLIDKAFTLAQECGGIAQLKRLVDRLAGV